jgi:hypothetical protein
MTARIGLFTAQIRLGLLLSVGFSCRPSRQAAARER